eukprot:GEMP01045069.1.p2 GENE.GEMP01045069.1~~GEMP01045069.1.p2  ORF type:complete len:101 (+),score=23.51 GEMP01045069.1:379-681(+)
MNPFTWPTPPIANRAHGDRSTRIHHKLRLAIRAQGANNLFISLNHQAANRKDGWNMRPHYAIKEKSQVRTDGRTPAPLLRGLDYMMEVVLAKKWYIATGT